MIETDADEDQPQTLTTGDTQAPFVGIPGVTFTVRDAARACAVHANTVRRRLKAGEFPNAFRDHTGTWRIPVADLEAAGLRPQRSQGEPLPRDVVVIPEASPMGLLRETYEALQILEDEADSMRATIDDLTRRAAFAETLAQERADRIEDLRLALRALEAVNPRPQERIAAMPEPVVQTQPFIQQQPAVERTAMQPPPVEQTEAQRLTVDRPAAERSVVQPVAQPQPPVQKKEDWAAETGERRSRWRWRTP